MAIWICTDWTWGESEEIPYTRFDLQEFFDPDMEAAVRGRCLEDISVTNML